MRERTSHSALTLAILLSFGSLSALWIRPASVWAQVDADTEALVSQAESLLTQEKRQPSLRTQRVAAFADAARRLAQRLAAEAESSGQYPVLLFRIGLYLYLSDAPADAQIILAECQKHPMLRSRDAVWKGQPIASHLQSFSGVRISASSDRTTTNTHEESLPESGMRLWAHSSKAHIQPFLRTEPEAPFSREEIQTQRRKVSLTRSPDGAREVAKATLSPLGTPVLSQQGRVIIAATENEAAATKIAAELSTIQKRVWSTLLGRTDEPPLLLIYANLDPAYSEQSASRLSMAVHGRTSANREGYYSPHDRTLVLRKGIVNENGTLYLGTGAHELVHGLIHADAPTTPSWLNEGLASLLEEQDASGKPIDNYRLYELLVALQTPQLLSLSSLLEGKPSTNIRLRDAMSRYCVLWLHHKDGPALVHKVYSALRESPKQSVPNLVASALQIPVAQLDDQFRAFVRSRDVALVDRRWSEIKPAELEPTKPTAAPAEGGAPIMQQSTGGPRIRLGPMMQQTTGGPRTRPARVTQQPTGGPH